jgi:hypothetical protein
MLLVKRIQFHYGRLKNFLLELENKNHIEERSFLSDYCFILGSVLVLFPFSALLVTSILFFLDIPMSDLNFYLALALSLILTYIIAANFLKGGQLVVVLFTTILISAAIYIGAFNFVGNFYDISYDGQAYHQEAIIQLSKGWNPYFQQITPQTANNLDIWLNHYPKGLWFLSTIIYKITGEIEMAKGFTIIFTFAAISFTFSALLLIKRINGFISFLISFVAAVNPISIYQFLSFYQDGVLLQLLICFTAIAFKIFHGKKGVKIIPFVAVICLFVNIKLTSLPYIVIFLAAFIILLWINEKVFLAIQMLKVSIFAIFLSVAIIGFSPYITNIVYKGNILYPAAGKDAKDYIKSNIPENLYDDNSFERLFISIFSRSANTRGTGSSADLKMPFTYDEEELKAFRDTNAKEGGFGPLFGGAMLLTLLFLTYIYIYIFIKWEVRFKYVIYMVSFIIVTIFLSAIINPASSLARFVPQIWLVTVITLILAFSIKSKITHIFGLFLIGTLLYNSYLIAHEYVLYNMEKTAQIENTLNDLSKSEDTLKIDLNEFSSTAIKLDNHNIKWERVYDNLECAKKERFLIHGVGEICKQ